MERLLGPIPELPAEEPDTELHYMPGPSRPAPKWVVDSWKRGLDSQKPDQEAQTFDDSST